MEKGLKLCTITPSILPTKREEDILLMELTTNKIKFNQNELVCIKQYKIWLRVYSLAFITTEDGISLKNRVS